MPGPRSYSISELVNATGFDRRTIVYYIQSGLLPKVGRRGPHTRYPEECLVRLQFIKGVRGLQAEGRLLTATLAEIRRALAARDAAGIRALLDRNLPVDEIAALFAEPEAESSPPPGTRRDPEPDSSRELSPPPAPGTRAPDASPAVRGPSGERRSYGLADAGIRKRFGVERPASPVAPQVHHEETHPGLPALNPTPIPEQAPAPVAGSGTVGAGGDPELGELLRELEVRPTLNAQRSPPGSPEQWTEIPITSRVYLSVRGLSAEDTPLAEAVARLLKRALRARSSTAAS